MCMMNVFAVDLNTYNKNHIYFLEPKPNLLIQGIFTKMIYTGEDFTINGIYLYNTLNENLLEEFETQVLDHYANHTNTRKEPSKYALNAVSPHKKSRSSSQILKLSGVWENETNYGLTFKWIETTIRS